MPQLNLFQTTPERETYSKAIEFMKQRNIVWKFNGTMYLNGKKLSKHLTGYYAKVIKSLMDH